MTLFRFCCGMWLVCVLFVLANVTDTAAIERESVILRRISAALKAASTVGLLLLTVLLYMEGRTT